MPAHSRRHWKCAVASTQMFPNRKRGGVYTASTIDEGAIYGNGTLIFYGILFLI